MKANPFSISLSLTLITSTYFLLPLIFYFPHATRAVAAAGGGGSGGSVPVIDGPTVRKDERWPLLSSEFGEISAVKISDGRNGSYHLHFITMVPQSLLLPVQLYSEMIFYVNSGSGSLSWMDVNKDDDKLQQVNLKTGDVYRLQPETVFYLENNLVDNDGQELQIYAIFSDSDDKLLQNKQGDEVYVGVHDLVLGFDNVVLQAALNLPGELMEELRTGKRQPLIVQGLPVVNYSMGEVGSRVTSSFLGTKNNDILNIQNKKDKNKKKAYNIHESDHDVENCYGWSAIVTKKQLDVLKDSDFSVFMVNLTKGSMIGPHWNPSSVEIAIVLRGQGMVQVVCPTITNEKVCKNSRFKVAEGDVFVVPRYHPMAQISFNNDTFVFMGFTLTSKDSFPQYLAGKLSILQKLDKTVLMKSFNVSNTTMDQVLSVKKESILLDCTSCAEDEEKVMEEEEEGREREGGKGGGDEGKQETERKGEIAIRRKEKEVEIEREFRRGKGGKSQKMDGERDRMEEEKEVEVERNVEGGGDRRWQEA
ncbi:vicilin-like seed storage protein At2g18540 [Lactuca sativa]|uniref:vicilin-like seed storage protein At2g18540 n=1 Tax=Lactuca sativa TaxID=4236 RepID=UPI000CB95F71|nr:vicilin-like seed storage protein At2g18540 [Lactuca sativa]